MNNEIENIDTMLFPQLDTATALRPLTAMPLDARIYFSSYEPAVKAAETAKPVGSDEAIYYYSQVVGIYDASHMQHTDSPEQATTSADIAVPVTRLYQIQPPKTEHDKPYLVEVGAISDWAENDSTMPNYIKNKPINYKVVDVNLELTGRSQASIPGIVTPNTILVIRLNDETNEFKFTADQLISEAGISIIEGVSYNPKTNCLKNTTKTTYDIIWKNLYIPFKPFIAETIPIDNDTLRKNPIEGTIYVGAQDTVFNTSNLNDFLKGTEKLNTGINTEINKQTPGADTYRPASTQAIKEVYEVTGATIEELDNRIGYKVRTETDKKALINPWTETQYSGNNTLTYELNTLGNTVKSDIEAVADSIGLVHSVDVEHDHNKYTSENLFNETFKGKIASINNKLADFEESTDATLIAKLHDAYKVIASYITKPDDSNLLFDTNNKINLAYLSDNILGQLLYGGIIKQSIESDESSWFITITAAFAHELNKLYGLKVQAGDRANVVQEAKIKVDNQDYIVPEGIFFVTGEPQKESTNVEDLENDEEIEYNFLETFELLTGDWLLALGGVWAKIDNTDAVRTVNGKIGNIKLDNHHYELKLNTELLELEVSEEDKSIPFNPKITYILTTKGLKEYIDKKIENLSFENGSNYTSLVQYIDTKLGESDTNIWTGDKY